MRNIKNILIIFVASSSLFAQGSSGIRNAQAVALGNSTVTHSRGVFALGENPANISLPDNYKYEFNTVLPFPNVSALGGSNLISLTDYKDYFTGVKNADGSITGKVLTESEKDNLLTLLSDSKLSADVSTSLFAFTYKHSPEVGAFAFSISDRISVRAGLPKSIVELLLFGNKINRTYNVKDLDAGADFTRQYSLSYAREINNLLPNLFKSLSAGISLNFITGYFHTDITKINSSFVTTENSELKVVNDLLVRIAASPSFGIKYDFEDVDKESNFSLFPSSAGTGFGIDLGLNAKLDEIWTVGLSLTDLGSISWNKETVGFAVDSSAVFSDFTDKDKRDSLSRGLEPIGAYIGGFSSSLPAALKMGVSMHLDKFFKSTFPGKMVVLLNYHQGFNDVPGNSTSPRISLGTEYRPLNWLPIRTGFSFGGLYKFSWGFGFGIGSDIYEYNLGISDFQSLLSESGHARFGVSMSGRWRF